MELKRIKTLLQKYYEGNASSDEADQLVLYFSENDVPDELIPDQMQILGLHDLRTEEIDIPEDLQSGIYNKLSEVQNIPEKKLSYRRILYPVASIAASLLILVSVLFFLNRDKNLGSFDDPGIAYAETKEAMELISKYFNKGTEPMGNIGRMGDAIQPLDALGKIGMPGQRMQRLKALDQGLQQTKGIIDINE